MEWAKGLNCFRNSQYYKPVQEIPSIAQRLADLLKHMTRLLMGDPRLQSSWQQSGIIEFRIKINLGDIVEEGGWIYGDRKGTGGRGLNCELEWGQMISGFR